VFRLTVVLAVAAPPSPPAPAAPPIPAPPPPLPPLPPAPPVASSLLVVATPLPVFVGGVMHRQRCPRCQDWELLQRRCPRFRGTCLVDIRHSRPPVTQRNCARACAHEQRHAN